MANDDVQIRFGADLKPLQDAAQKLKTVLADIRSAAAEVSGALAAALRQTANTPTAAPDPAANAEALQAAARAQAEAAEETQRVWERSVDPVVQKFSEGMLQVAEKARSLRQVMFGIGQDILASWVRNVAQMVSHWAMGIVQHVAAERAGQAAIIAAKQTGASQGLAIDALASLKEVVNSAAAAAAKAYQALAGIPVVGPVLGAAAAAATFGAVMAFQGLIASAAGGFDIPAGLNPIAQLHQREMVLPAHIADPFRSFLADYGRGGGAGAGGDAHLHYAPTINAPANATLRQMLVDQGSDMISFVQAAVRNGSLKLA
jgi:hypothetical protein